MSNHKKTSDDDDKDFAEKKASAGMLDYAIRLRSQLGEHLGKAKSASKTPTHSSIRAPAKLAKKTASDYASSDEIDTMFRQYPDLFREATQVQTGWSESWPEVSSSATPVLLIKDQANPLALREYLLSDSRLRLCAMAERLGDACRKIRQHSYQVIVLAMGEHTKDILPLLELMNSVNPRAKAVAVMDRPASEQMQSMLHPKVMGYVAAEDAPAHLTDTILEVAQGRFTASPGISDIVMQLTSNYLAARSPMNSAVIHAPGHVAHPASAPDQHSGFDALSPISTSFSPSSFTGSSFAVSQFGAPSGYGGSVGMSGFPGMHSSPRSSKQLLSERESEILQLIAGGLSSAEMAHELAISLPTVNTHVRNIFTKLGVRTRAQAIHSGIAQGFILVT